LTVPHDVSAPRPGSAFDARFGSDSPPPSPRRGGRPLPRADRADARRQHPCPVFDVVVCRRRAGRRRRALCGVDPTVPSARSARNAAPIATRSKRPTYQLPAFDDRPHGSIGPHLTAYRMSLPHDDERPSNNVCEARVQSGSDRDRADRLVRPTPPPSFISGTVAAGFFVAELDRTDCDCAARRCLLGIEAEVGQAVVVGPDPIPTSVPSPIVSILMARHNPRRISCPRRRRGGSRRLLRIAESSRRTLASARQLASRASHRAGLDAVRREWVRQPLRQVRSTTARSVQPGRSAPPRPRAAAAASNSTGRRRPAAHRRCGRSCETRAAR